MLGTVLVPLDGSGFAEAALPLASRLVARSRGRLHLVTAAPLVGVAVSSAELVPTIPLYGPDERQLDEAYLASTAAQLGTVGEGPVHVGLVDGAAGEVICDEAGRIGADLIVMATHGRNAMARLWIGSVADHVIRESGRPVLLVKPRRIGGRQVELPIRNILVPLDRTDFSERILEPVITLAGALGATLTLLTVVAPEFGIAEPELPPPAPQHPAISARRLDEAHRRLDRLVDFYRAREWPVRSRVTLAATPVGGILDVLAEDQFDMVALATHGATGIRRMLVGSVARSVIESTGKPILVYHPLA